MLVLIAYSELGTKSNQTRRRMLDILKNNIRNVLGDCKFHNIRNRLLVEMDVDPEPLSRVFGIAYYAVCDHFTFNTLDDIGNYLKAKYPTLEGKTYKLSVRREGTHEFTSIDAQKYLAKFIKGGRVNLKSPELTIHIEIRQNDVLIYDRVVRGPGGLPIGAEDRVLMLFSGGIDSPVAAWMMLKRGCSVDYLFINNGGPDQANRVYSVYHRLATLWGSGRKSRFYIVDGKQITSKIIQSVNPKYRQVVLKKMFYEIAISLANKKNYSAIITGESIGQVSTQTVANLRAIQQGFDHLFIRPLVGLNKEEIITLSKRIGTYELSTSVGELCNIAEGKVVTHTSPEKLSAEYSKIQPIEFSYSEYEPTNLEIPEDAIYVSADSPPKDLDPSKFYIITCKSGFRAELLAEELRTKGIKAVGMSEKELEDRR